MRYLEVGPVRPSRVVLGGAFGERPDHVTFEMLDAFVDAGGTAIETAHAYALGAAEKQIGRWLASRGCRDSVVLIDKGCHPERGRPDRVDVDALTSDLNDALERLGTEYIDIYMVHRDSPDRPMEPLLEALDAEQSRGRIRSFGVCNWAHERVVESFRHASAQQFHPPAVISAHFSLAEQREPMWEGTRQVDASQIAWHIESQIPLLAWSSQARGWFSGAYLTGQRSDPNVTRVYDTPLNNGRLERARQLARERGISSAQVAFAYVLSQPFPVLASVGPESLLELREIVGASDLTLNPNECAFLMQAVA